MKYSCFALSAALLAALTTGCSDERLPDPSLARSYVVASGFAAPIGMAADEKGQVWVSESGTGQNDGRVSVVTKDGLVYPVFTGFSSVFANGAIEGMGHVLYRNGTLYILDGGAGRLYRADVSGIKPGDPAQPASGLPSEDIGTYVRSLNLTTPVNSPGD